MSEIAIRVERLSKKYHIRNDRVRYRTLRDTLSAATTAPCRRLLSRSSTTGARPAAASDSQMWALKDVSFEVRRGDIVGVVGRNGAGKSTLLKILSRITEPTRGFADVYGRVGSLLEVGTGFHSELTGRENVYLSGAILGMRRSEIERNLDGIVAFAEVERFLDTPVKYYSSGMYLRLAFAVAAHLEPQILLVDEVLAVGDAAFQKRCLGKMGEVAQDGRTILFVSHNMAAIRSLCTTGLLLTAGEAVYTGAVNRCLELYYNEIGAFQSATGEPSGPCAQRPFFGPISLDGQSRNSIDQSAGFELSTMLSIPRSASGFSMYCILEDLHGRQLFVLREESTGLGLHSVSAGSHKLSLRLPPLWLNPGLYSLYFKVLLWGERGAARHVSDRLSLDVGGSSSMVDCVLNPRAGWLWGGESECSAIKDEAQPSVASGMPRTDSTVNQGHGRHHGVSQNAGN